MLFPPPPPNVRYFKPKNSQGVLAKFCAECGSHLDAHAYQWVTGGTGTIRACPPENSISGSSNNNNSANVSAIHQNQSQQNISQNNQGFSNSSSRLNGAQNRSHHVWKHEADVDLSLTSSGLVGEKKTVGNVPAHHRFYQNKVKEAQKEQEILDHQQNSASSYDPRQGMPPVPQAHPHDENNNNNDQQQQQPPVYFDEETGEYFYYEEDLQPGQTPPQLPSNTQLQQHQQNNNTNHNQYQQQQPEGFNSNQPGGRNFRLYDEAYTTPIPFGTESDLINPPHVSGPKGKRHIPAQDHTGPLAPEEQYFSKLNEKKKMSTNRERMEKGNLSGAGGIAVSQDSVRPDQEIPRTHVSKQRRDAQGHLSGAGCSWK